MKKIEIHLFSKKTNSDKTIKISLLYILGLFLCIVLALLGFIFFSPLQIYDKISSNQIFQVYAETKALKEEIKNAKNVLENTKISLEEANKLKDSLFSREELEHFKEVKKTVATPSAENFIVLLKNRTDFYKKLKEDKTLAKNLPLRIPLKKEYRITNRYQMMYDPRTEQMLPHRGIDFACAPGDTVYATGGGKISEIKTHRGFGLTLKLDHSDEIRTFYAHLQNPLVKVGTEVQRGDPIALVGNSGQGAGNILHYEIRYDGNALNPEYFFLENYFLD